LPTPTRADIALRARNVMAHDAKSARAASARPVLLHRQTRPAAPADPSCCTARQACARFLTCSLASLSLACAAKAILSFLEAKAADFPHVAGELVQMSELYTRKLWHQITLLLLAVSEMDGVGSLLQPLYETFVSDFKHRLNKLALARLQVAVTKQMGSLSQQTFFCTSCAEEAKKEDKQAHSYLLCELARMLLEGSEVAGAKERLDQAAEYLEGAAGVEAMVQASYYRAWASYYKIKGPAAEFYQKALLLLAYAPLEQMTQDEKLTISFDLGIAALVGEGLYNFGELLEHPVVATLEQTQFAWLADLLRAFNAGDIAQYEALVMAHRASLEDQPALLANTTFLKEKITLMFLTQMLFARIGPSGERTVPFQAIAEGARLQVSEVELLVMRALSLGLIRGTLDEVDQTLRVHWVQPRVLAKEQIGLMSERLKTWTETVQKTLVFLENETPEFATS
jgi:26S proteasome regulatory subunit N9